MTKEEMIEQLADKEHDSWARWTAYLFSGCKYNPDGSLIVPSDYVVALRKQIDTPYSQLSEREKQYDRDEVAHILPIIEAYKHGPVVQTSLPDGSPSPHVPHPGLGAPL